MSDLVQGSNVNVLVEIDSIWTYIGCATDCSWQFVNEIIGKTDVNAGLFRKKRVRMSDSRASVSGLITSGTDVTKASIFYFLQEGIRRTELNFKFLYTDDDGIDVFILMTAIISDTTLSGDASNLGEFDMQLEGTGNVLVDQLDSPSPSESPCDQLYSGVWATTPGATSISGANISGDSRSTLANMNVISVDREGTGQDETTGTPGNRQYVYTGTNLLQTDAGNPYNSGETIFIIWSEP